MKRYLISTVAVLVVLAVACGAFAQDEETPAQRVQRQREIMRQRFENMSEAEREKFRAEMRQRRERLENMSEEEREKFRAEMRERFGAGRPVTGRQEQLKAIEAIEEQVAKLKAAMQSTGREARGSFRDISEDERAKLRERMVKAGQERERPARPRIDVESERPGKRAPAFELNSFDGKTVSLSDYRGKIVVLEWLNFECPYSRYHYETKNTMVELAKKYKGKNVVWLAVNSTNHTTPEPNKTFAERHRLPYLILDDRPGKVGRAYGAETTPHMYIINPRGRIVYEGAIDDSPMGRKKEGVINYVDNALAELTARKAVSTPKTKPYGCTVKYAR